VIESGREALSDIYLKTKFMRSNVQPVANYGGFTFTLLKVVPHTGRTHQIRVHTKALNAEILGDPLYCGRKQLGFARAEKIPLMLHARNLKILNYNLTADYPKTFEKIVKKIWRL
jgi:23S rRNA-/tRNA-specific pseudouridylate synthase